MRILVEHVIFSPYTGVIHGGAEKSTYTQIKALRTLGHDVDLLAPSDSTLPCIKAPVLSGHYVLEHGGVMKMKQWYQFLREVAQDYDGVLLNHPMTSQSILTPDMAELLSKAAYINHDPTPWYVQGAGGMRMLTNLRWLRYNGGTSFYLSTPNRDYLEWVWNHPKKGPEVRGQCCAGGVKRIGHTDFFNTELFDGQFNQWVYPDNVQQVSAPQGYLIAIGRPDASKRLHLAAELAAKQNKKLIVCCTSTNGGAAPHPKLFDKLRALGADLRFDLPHDEIMRLVAGADCLVFPSKYENFSNVVCEAMCHGVPVSHMEPQAPLDHYPGLSREWGDVEPNTLEERQQWQTLLQENTLRKHGERLVALLP